MKENLIIGQFFDSSCLLFFFPFIFSCIELSDSGLFVWPLGWAKSPKTCVINQEHCSFFKSKHLYIIGTFQWVTLKRQQTLTSLAVTQLPTPHLWKLSSPFHPQQDGLASPCESQHAGGQWVVAFSSPSDLIICSSNSSVQSRLWLMTTDPLTQCYFG